MDKSIKIGKVTIEYLIEPDDSDERQIMQTLTVTAQPALLHLYDKNDMDDEKDYYIVIETNRFAVGSSDDLVAILRDFEQRFKYIDYEKQSDGQSD